ncbi:GumC family protein [Pontibacter silvestris]|uniref:non-specific protein-tyrosine kinase n=1 Tax=Pontibacter silvestris TaxID=2305183 RepID=A0ABW4X1R9_9BACT|nr:tyrosine-protein kinase family protein [Pontibacter silvestris]MCC9135070.1 polysaccharide biosynthesis tyrosine autokinase [Pontibacter silvestris]
MKRNKREKEIDLKSWLFKFRNKWYYFALSLVILLGLAFLYVKTTTPLYQVKSTLKLGDKNTGSKEAQELLSLLGTQEQGVTVEDEVGVLKSKTMLYNTINSLDFDVSYYHIKDNWINTFGNLVVEEQYENTPYKVVLDSTSNQIVNQPIYITMLPNGKYRFTLTAEDASIYNFDNRRVVNMLPIVELDREMEFGEKYNDGSLSFTIYKNDSTAASPAASAGTSYFKINDPTSLVTSYQKRLEVVPIGKDSRILDLHLQSPVPNKDIKFLDALAKQFKAHDLNQKNETGKKTLAFIEEQLGTIADSLEKSEEALTSYRSSQNITDVAVQSSTGLQKLNDLEAERAKLMVNKKYYSSILSGVRNDNDLSNISSPPSAESSPILSSLIMKLTELQREKAGYSISATDANPVIKVMNEEIRNTKNALLENISNTIKSINISLAEVDTRIATVRTALNALPENERRLQSLRGKSAFNDKNYAFLLEKRTEASITLATNASDIEVVDQAHLSDTKPVNSKASGIFALSFLVGLILPAGLIILSDKADDTIKGKDELKAITSIPFLGVVAHNPDKDDKLVMLHNNRSAIAESFRSVRINFQYLSSSTGSKVVGITSSISGEGKTFCSVNLSLELASAGRKVILIETDLRKPTFSNYFNINNEIGLSNYITDDINLRDAIQPSEHPNLDIISSGPIPANAIEVLEMPRMRELVHLLREQYDYVILDTPPVGFVSEYFIMMKYTDATIYVVRQQYTQKNLLQPINELYEDGKIQNISMIINDVNYSKTYEYGYKTKAKGYYV